MPADPVRDAALRAIIRVLASADTGENATGRPTAGSRYLDVCLDRIFRRRHLSGRGRRFATQLAYGTVRHKTLCDYVLEPLVHQPLTDLPRSIHSTLRMGVFQALFCEQVTFPAMVHTSVDLAKKHGHSGTARLTNAVLRRVPQSLGEVRFPDPGADMRHYLSVRFSMPEWLVEAWISQSGEEGAAALCRASSEPAPTTLRANGLKTTSERLANDLQKAGWPTHKQTNVPEELTLRPRKGAIEDDARPLTETKVFQHGHFMIQDPASMLPPHLMEPEAGDTILDLCAAPGGKTTHTSELAHGASTVVALDRECGKLDRLRENVSRLESPGVRIVCGDGRQSPFRGGFDKVLVDAPCTGLGTLRRHPELKWHTRPEDPRRMAEIQRDLLRSAVELCKNAGVIVYSVCTLTPDESRDPVRSVLDACGVEPEDGPDWMGKWKRAKGTYQTQPDEDGLDGFFLTRLRKGS